MTTEETRFLAGRLDGLADRLDRVETNVDGLEDAFVAMKSKPPAGIWRTAFTTISVHAGAIGLSFALFRLYTA